jgi:hypothetical protein
MIGNIIKALRVGTSIKNETGVKWAGAAVAFALVGLTVAQSFGYLEGVQSASVIELVMVLVVLYTQVATTTKIGLLPPDRHDAMRLERERLRNRAAQAVSPGVAQSGGDNTPERRTSDGFPTGPFFDS